MRTTTHVIILLTVILGYLNLKAETPIIQKLEDDRRFIYDDLMIDSITFSHYDLDSVLQPNLVTQAIWHNGFADRALISEMQEVRFLHKPEKKLRPNVYEIKGELLESVISFTAVSTAVDTLGIKISKYCPQSQMPKIGDKLYTLQMRHPFPYGFMGKVTDISETENAFIVTCDALDYEDIFESFYGAYDTGYQLSNNDYNPSDSVARIMPRISPSEEKHIKDLPGFSYNLPLDFLDIHDIDGFDFDVSQNLNVELFPRISVTNLIYVENGRKTRNCSYSMELNTSVTESIQGSASYSKEFEIANLEAPIPVAPWICLYASTGIFADIEIENATFSATLSKKYKLEGSCQFDKSEVTGINVRNIEIKPEFTVHSFSGKGTIGIGPYIKVGIQTGLEKIWNGTGGFSFGDVSCGVKGGVRCVVDAQYSQDMWDNSETDTRLYEALSKPDNVKVELFGAATAEASIAMFNTSTEIDLGTKPIFTSPILPRFKQINLDDSQSDFFHISAPYQASFLSPYIGFGVYDISNGQDNAYIVDSYNAGIAQHTDAEALGVFESPKPDFSLRIHPYLQYKGKKILACPKFDYEVTLPKSYIKSAEIIDEFIYNNDSYWYVKIVIDNVSSDANILTPDYAYIDGRFIKEWNIDMSECDVWPNIIDCSQEDESLVLHVSVPLYANLLNKSESGYNVRYPLGISFSQMNKQIYLSTVIEKKLCAFL